MIELRNVTVRYANNKKNALSSINISIGKGEFVCVLGKSGAGKSTLIRCMNGLQQTTDGDVFFDRKPLSQMNVEQMRKTRREIGMIFQHFNLVPRLTVLQNVSTGLFGYRNSFKNLIGWFSNEEIEKVKNVIHDVGLSEHINQKVEQLSGGQKQRVGIARALLQQPSALLGDEPVASLDPGTANHIFTLLKEMHHRHDLLSVINVHDVSLAKRYATRIVALKNGEIIFDGKPYDFNSQLYEQTYDSIEETRKELLLTT
jgi:phosphonate transport system ATP-binding protein